LFVKSDELVKRLGNAIKKIVKKERGICEEIKNALKEEIAERIISTRTIELQCPPEWKRKTKPTRENEKISFSKLEDKPRHKVAAIQGGQSITETEKEDGNGLDTSSPARGPETGINSDTLAPKSDSATITLLQEETASRPGIAVLVNNRSRTICDCSSMCPVGEGIEAISVHVAMSLLLATLIMLCGIPP
jgi:hypothetical protein